MFHVFIHEEDGDALGSPQSFPKSTSVNLCVTYTSLEPFISPLETKPLVISHLLFFFHNGPPLVGEGITPFFPFYQGCIFFCFTRPRNSSNGLIGPVPLCPSSRYDSFQYDASLHSDIGTTDRY